MRAYGLRLPVVLAALAAVLAILFGLQFVLRRQAVSLPLATRLRDVPGVVGPPVITPGAAALDIEVHLGAVADLRSTYDALLVAAGAGSGQRVNLQIDDTRTPALTADYYKLNVVLDQGRATGQFVPMETAFSAESQQLQLSQASVVLGDSQMFVTLMAGSSYLYAITPLVLASGTTGGGGS